MAIINGTAGNNTLNGTPDPDTINGLGGNDTITGGTGNDLVRMGTGNDRFLWRAGDGDDTLRGQDGFDTLIFEGFGLGEIVTISRNASRVRVSDNLGATLDLDDIERIFVRPLTGVDGVLIENLAGTDLKQVVVDLAGVPGGGSDGEVDAVVRRGGSANDIINVALASGAVSLTGPAAQVTIRNADVTDLLQINGLGGSDTIDASKLPANIMRLSVEGDTGNDKITGSRGNDELFGGTGNDLVIGGRGNDTVNLGNGNDVFAWSMNDGQDLVQGGDGIDTVRVSCTNSDDLTLIGSAGSAVTIGNASFMQIIGAEDCERIQIRALGGADSISVGDLFTTDVKEVTIDLAASAGGALADTDADTVIVRPSGFVSTTAIGWSGSNLVVSGLTEEITIAHAGKNDTIWIRCQGSGDHTIDAGDLGAGRIRLKLEGNSGDDALFGSAGNDTAIGGEGNDLATLGAGNDLFQGGIGDDRAFLGAGNDRVSGNAGNDRAFLGTGNDVFLWRPGDGDDVVEGQAGFDTFDFKDNTSMLSGLALSAVGGLVQILYLGGFGTSLLNDVERIRAQGGDGIDFYQVGKLAGTDLKQLVILDFDGNPLGGNDVLVLDPLFDALGVGATSRAGRVSIVDKGATVDVFVNADGNAANGFELAVATLHTVSSITVGQDVMVGT